MGAVVFLFIAVVLVVLQHTLFAGIPLAPDLPLALVAWAVVDGGERGVLVRAWIVGLIRDCVDPGSTCFHTVAYFTLALVFLPMRAVVFHSRGVAWMLWAAVASVLLTAIDAGFIAGVAPRWPPMLVGALFTGLATLPMAWLLKVLPRDLHPIGHGGE